VHEARSRQLLSLSVRSIDYLITNREIASRRVGRLVLIHGDAIEQFAKRDHVCIRQNKAAGAAGILAIRRAG
jgi:excisionase family DNA binding protein